MVTIGTLNGGNITITTGGSTPTGHPETRITLEGGIVDEHNISGTFDYQWLETHGYFDSGDWIRPVIEIDLGNTVTGIGANTFYFCYRCLTNVIIGSGVKTIGGGAFADSSSITNITIPDTIESIDTSAFSNTAISTVTIVSNGGNALTVK